MKKGQRGLPESLKMEATGGGDKGRKQKIPMIVALTEVGILDKEKKQVFRGEGNQV